MIHRHTEPMSSTWRMPMQKTCPTCGSTTDEAAGRCTHPDCPRNN